MRNESLWAVFIICLTVIAVSIIIVISQPISMEGKIECTSGDVGVTYNLNNSGNLTLDGVNGMSCNIEYKGELPFFRAFVN